ncbi:hypothetical protein L6452_38496 [Arctium lappa]|uniref:Uncharacterized protein n=1 Tax=Arctium lappa TaxID=4217 RepID=A0ACB8XTU4_ARCLA|nr:hypothetical protein L6452_38496 [Arctium lappa]
MDALLPPPKQIDIIPIATYLANLKTQKTSWIGGRITVLPQDRSYTQTGCADCLKPLEADLTWIVQCPTCKKECEVQLILRVAVQIDDGTSAIKTMLTSPIIEKFLTMTSTQIRNAEEVGENIQAIADRELNGQTIVAFARAYETTYQRQPETRIFLINGHRTKGESSHTQLIIDSKKRKAIETTCLQKTTQTETDMKTPTKKQKSEVTTKTT